MAVDPSYTPFTGFGSFGGVSYPTRELPNSQVVQYQQDPMDWARDWQSRYDAAKNQTMTAYRGADGGTYPTAWDAHQADNSFAVDQYRGSLNDGIADWAASTFGAGSPDASSVTAAAQDWARSAHPNALVSAGQNAGVSERPRWDTAGNDYSLGTPVQYGSGQPVERGGPAGSVPGRVTSAATTPPDWFATHPMNYADSPYTGREVQVPLPFTAQPFLDEKARMTPLMENATRLSQAYSNQTGNGQNNGIMTEAYSQPDFRQVNGYFGQDLMGEDPTAGIDMSWAGQSDQATNRGIYDPRASTSTGVYGVQPKPWWKP